MAETELINALQRLAHSPSPDMARQVIAYAVSRILAKQRLLGEILMRIPRQMVAANDAVVALVWQQDQLTLVIDFRQLRSLRAGEIESLLMHEAYHVLWQHPLRYDQTDHPELTTVACDVTVNQYLDEPPQGTMTLSQLERLTRVHFQSGQSSSYYRRQLLALPLKQQKRVAQYLQASHDTQRKGASRKLHGPLETHAGWQIHGEANQLLRTAQLKKVVQGNLEALTQRQRGLLPERIRQTLGPMQEQVQLPINAAIRRVLGAVPNGKQDSRARFNRQQPLRLELPGQITKYVSRLYVFVDQSGSMPDKMVKGLLDLCQRLVTQLDTEVVVVAFDAAIEGKPQQLKSAADHLENLRQGGGGTSYQPIFDYLKAQRRAKNTPILILTDGWGDEQIDDHGFHNVLWLLTTDSPLSVKNIPTNVMHLRRAK